MSCAPASDMQIWRTLSTIEDEPVSSSHIFNEAPPSGNDSVIVHDAWPPPMLLPPVPPHPATAAAATIAIARSHPMRRMFTAPTYAGGASIESARALAITAPPRAVRCPTILRALTPRR